MTHIEHQEALIEMEQNRAFDLLDRQGHIDNAKSINAINYESADKIKAEAELIRAKAKLRDTMRGLAVLTWIVLIPSWVALLIHHHII